MRAASGHIDLYYTSYTSLFQQDMIQDIYISHWNLIQKLIGVTWNVGPYKLIIGFHAGHLNSVQHPVYSNQNYNMQRAICSILLRENDYTYIANVYEIILRKIVHEYIFIIISFAFNY